MSGATKIPMTWLEFDAWLWGGSLLDSLLADFLAALVFFTALTYAILGRRFEHQRSAVVMAAALGLALAVGLVWWEQRTGWSMRSLGPVAVGLFLVVLAAVLYQAMRGIGGNWAGAGAALGVTVLIGSTLDSLWPIPVDLVRGLAILFLITAVALLVARQHREVHDFRHGVPARDRIPRHNEQESVSEGIRSLLRRARRVARDIPRRPEATEQVRDYLGRALPIEGWLTEQLAKLRERATLTRAGHVAKLSELRDLAQKLSVEQREKLSAEIRGRYQALELDTRLERLDTGVAETERRVKQFTKQAQRALDRQDYRTVAQSLDKADALQKHVSQLMRAIEATDARLSKLLAASKAQFAEAKQDQP
jgi:hypothetical protein